MAHEIHGDSKLSDSNCQEEEETHRDWAELCHQLKELRSSMFINGAESIRAKIKAIVPQYSFQLGDAGEPFHIVIASANSDIYWLTSCPRLFSMGMR